MKLLNILTPKSWIGKLALWAMFFLAGYAFALKTLDPCPPVTQVNVDQKNKVKKGSQMSNSLTGIETNTDCVQLIKSLSMKEIKEIRKN